MRGREKHDELCSSVTFLAYAASVITATTILHNIVSQTSPRPLVYPARVTSLPAVETNRSTSPAAVRYLSPLGSIDDAPAPRSRPVSPARATRAAEWETAASEWEEAMEKSLKNVLADGNPVLQLFTKRIYKVLLRAVLGQPYLNKLPSLSLHAKGIQRNLSELIASAVKLFALHNSAYGDVYSMIFSSHTFQHHVFPPVETDVD